jgi:glycosyltransferase involved in cell wall biosynthesis
MVANGFGSLGAVYGAIPYRRLRVLYSEDGVSVEEVLKAKKRRVYLRRIVARKIQYFIVPSVVLRRTFVDVYKLPDHKVLLVTNGVDCTRFEPGEKDGIRAQIGLQASEFVVGNVANLLPAKNQRLLVRTFVDIDMPLSKLLIVGAGSANDIFDSQFDPPPQAKTVVLLGSVRDIAPCYRAMDLFVLSSDTEQMPMALLEAMASGLPVVVTDVGDCAAIVGTRDPQVVVPAGDGRALGNAILYWRANPNKSAKFGDLNRRRVEQFFSLAPMLLRYKGLIDDSLYK